MFCNMPQKCAPLSWILSPLAVHEKIERQLLGLWLLLEFWTFRGNSESVWIKRFEQRGKTFLAEPSHIPIWRHRLGASGNAWERLGARTHLCVPAISGNCFRKWQWVFEQRNSHNLDHIEFTPVCQAMRNLMHGSSFGQCVGQDLTIPNPLALSAILLLWRWRSTERGRYYLHLKYIYPVKV